MHVTQVIFTKLWIKNVGYLPLCLVLLSFLRVPALQAQEKATLPVWQADLGNGRYRNPIIHADYSDPDVCRVGDDFYMTASSFNAVPGLPILHSKDLVNWALVGHALPRVPPFDLFSKPQHGNGVWAPAIRYHQGEFHIYWGDPDFGIYMVKAKDAKGPWSEPVLVESGKGLIDACPLWDEDGKAYLVHAYAGSRAGIKSILVVKPMNWEGTKTIGAGKLVFDGHDAHPTVEGSKFYKRNGFYYIFAPAGGVATGWQLVLRSKSPYGPYEERIVLEQGNTPINGPHQGAWVELANGEDWFLHFQDLDAYGRVVHLQPMQWKEDWPVIGEDLDGEGTGQPVLEFAKPNVGKQYPAAAPATSDEFDQLDIGLQWQWHANPLATWAFVHTGKQQLRLFTAQVPAYTKNLWDVPNLLLQKFPAEEFVVTTRLIFRPNPKLIGEKIGLVVMGTSYGHLSIQSKADGIYLYQTVCQDAENGGGEVEKLIQKIPDAAVYLRVSVSKGAIYQFSYSLDGTNFQNAGDTIMAMPGKWIGAKLGLFATKDSQTNDAGFVDVDWFRFSKQ